MKMLRLNDPIRYQEKIQPFLIQHEAENNLLLGILNNVISGEYRRETPYLAYVDQNGQPGMAVMCTPPFPVLLSYQVPAPDDEILDLVLADLMDFLGDRFAGVSGDKELAARMKGAWEDETGGMADLHMAMRIYKLEQVIPVGNTAGLMRLAEKKDKALLQEWYSSFQAEAAQEEPDPIRVERQVDLYLSADLKRRGLLIWENDGTPVSMAGYAGPTPNGIRIGAVYTPPEHRKQGYASAVTAGLSQYLLDQGYKFCFLYTDLLNPTSNHIYQQIGYQPVCDSDRYNFK